MGNPARLGNKNPPAPEVRGTRDPRGGPCSLSAWSRVCVAFLSGSACWFSWFSLAWGSPSSQGWFRHPSTPSSMGNWGPFIFLFGFLFPRRFFFFRIADSMGHHPLTARSPGTRVGALDSVPNSLLFNSMPLSPCTWKLDHYQTSLLPIMTIGCFLHGVWQGGSGMACGMGREERVAGEDIPPLPPTSVARVWRRAHATGRGGWPCRGTSTFLRWCLLE